MLHLPTFEHLERLIVNELSTGEMELVRRAYEVAAAAHKEQKRDEGSPYIVHPIRVAASLAGELQIHSPNLICSALMHDVIEDSEITRSEIAGAFGDEVAEVVWLLTKFEDMSLADYLSAIEAAADTGAPIVKLCDRLDNLRYLSHSPKLEKKHRYVRTTEAYYLPMAARTDDYLYMEIGRELERIKEHLNSEKGQF